MMGWQWHQLGHMHIICTSLQTDTMPVPYHSVFYRLDALPATQPTVSKHESTAAATVSHCYTGQPALDGTPS